jgi:aspartate aminotransferase-like enzyme
MALQMGTRLIERGVLVGTVVSPGVPPGHARLRLSVMASHTQEQLQTALEAIEGVARELGFWEATAQRERIVPASKEEPACLN